MATKKSKRFFQSIKKINLFNYTQYSTNSSDDSHLSITEKSSHNFTMPILLGGLISMTVSLGLLYAIGIRIEETILAVLLGFAMAKLILYVILPKFITRISMHGDIDKSIEDGNDGYKTSQSLSTLLKGAASKVLAFAAVVYFLTHYTAPLLDKLGPIADAVTMIIPGLQIVAIAVFACTAVYLITSKMNAYRKERRNQKNKYL